MGRNEHHQDHNHHHHGEGDRSTSAAAARHELGLELTTLCLFLQRGLGRLGSATSSAAAAAGLETGSQEDRYRNPV